MQAEQVVQPLARPMPIATNVHLAAKVASAHQAYPSSFVVPLQRLAQIHVQAMLIVHLVGLVEVSVSLFLVVSKSVAQAVLRFAQRLARRMQVAYLVDPLVANVSLVPMAEKPVVQVVQPTAQALAKPTLIAPLAQVDEPIAWQAQEEDYASNQRVYVPTLARPMQIAVNAPQIARSVWLRVE